MNTDETNKVYSPLWHQIYAIVRQIPRANVEGDAMDASSATTQIEKLLTSLSPSPQVTSNDVRIFAKQFLRNRAEDPSMMSVEDMLVKFYCDLEGIEPSISTSPAMTREELIEKAKRFFEGKNSLTGIDGDLYQKAPNIIDFVLSLSPAPPREVTDEEIKRIVEKYQHTDCTCISCGIWRKNMSVMVRDLLTQDK